MGATCLACMCLCTAELDASKAGVIAGFHCVSVLNLDQPCSKAVPAFFINSHVDLCLMGSSHLYKAAVVSGNFSSRAGLEAAAPGAVEAPFEPLAVPPKLVPSLATEKVGEL